MHACLSNEKYLCLKPLTPLIKYKTTRKIKTYFSCLSCLFIFISIAFSFSAHAIFALSVMGFSFLVSFGFFLSRWFCLATAISRQYERVFFYFCLLCLLAACLYLSFQCQYNLYLPFSLCFIPFYIAVKMKLFSLWKMGKWENLFCPGYCTKLYHDEVAIAFFPVLDTLKHSNSSEWQRKTTAVTMPKNKNWRSTNSRQNSKRNKTTDITLLLLSKMRETFRNRIIKQQFSLA